MGKNFTFKKLRLLIHFCALKNDGYVNITEINAEELKVIILNEKLLDLFEQNWLVNDKNIPQKKYYLRLRDQIHIVYRILFQEIMMFGEIDCKCAEVLKNHSKIVNLLH